MLGEGFAFPPQLLPLFASFPDGQKPLFCICLFNSVCLFLCVLFHLSTTSPSSVCQWSRRPTTTSLSLSLSFIMCLSLSSSSVCQLSRLIESHVLSLSLSLSLSFFCLCVCLFVFFICVCLTFAPHFLLLFASFGDD